MAAKQYHDHIAHLRTRPVRPSFEQVTRLVEGHVKGKSFAFGVPSVKVLAVLVVLVSMAGGYWLFNPAGLRQPVAAPGINFQEKPNAALSVVTSSVRGTYTSPRPHTSYGTAKLSSQEDPALQAIPSLPQFSLAARAPVRQAFFTLQAPTTSLDTEQPSQNRYFLEAGGSAGFQLSADPAYHLASFGEPFIAGGYDLTQNISVGLVGGMETFMVRQNTYSTAFHDTTFTHDGNTYQNIIGNVITSPVASQKQVAYVGGSVRYWVKGSSLVPFAELMAAGSNEGAIAGATLGMQVLRSGNISVDVAASLRELFPSSGAPFMKVGAGAALRWDF